MSYTFLAITGPLYPWVLYLYIQATTGQMLRKKILLYQIYTDFSCHYSLNNKYLHCIRCCKYSTKVSQCVRSCA